MLTEWQSPQGASFMALDNNQSDCDYKQIATLLDEVLTPPDTDESAIFINRRLRELLFLLEHQFQTEKHLMKLAFYPHHAKHESEHRKLLNEFEMFLNISGFNRHCLRHFTHYIRDRIGRHQDSADKLLDSFLRSTPESVRDANYRRATEIALSDSARAPRQG
jgi:hemerythrin